MYAAEFEGLLYTTFPEQPFKNHIINIKDEKDDCNISDYFSQIIGMIIETTMTYIYCHQKKRPKVLKDD